ncbi:SDR family oxidoreductase [Chitinophaga solisilvae]|uniref:SDR family oxidoreductase n=1 Tax=Chitinophaga solisilvae TaxID=1233460 RepID=A0A3S1CQ51_9BACT|nr:SDR family oxidoreductase [Chitinophaga solisilvae]NSL88246.1 SDR family oxidoreductase [Chitinophaga solisilvae]
MSKVILVTGASTGLGASIATYLTSRGYTVYGVSRNIQPEGHTFHTLQMDVSREDSIRQAVQTIIDEQGRIDVLINNAGLGLAGPVENLSLTDVSRVFDTNVMGLLRTTQAVLPFMRRQQSGLVINISSIASENGLPYRAAYSASKAAVDRLTEAMRTELAPYGVQACYVQPGGFNTDINANRITTTLPAGSVYKNSWERCMRIVHDSVSKGMSTEVFAPLIEKIIQQPRVKRMYRIGKPLEKFSVLLKKILPARTYEKMVSNHFQI